MGHHLIARLEGIAVRWNVVEVGLMALGPAEMITNTLYREASLLYEICNELLGLGFRLWNTAKLEIER